MLTFSESVKFNEENLQEVYEVESYKEFNKNNFMTQEMDIKEDK